MKVDLYHAPLSQEAEKLLKDPTVVRDLLIQILEGGERRHFEVKDGARTIDVSSSAAVTPDRKA